MAIPIVSPVDFTLNELRNALLHLLASDPASGTKGQAWFNTTANVPKFFDGTANRTVAALSNSLDQFAAPAADLSVNSHKLTNVATPTAASDGATKGYVDSVAQGLDVKASVRAATTAPGTLASSFANGSVIDGITLATGDRVLLKNQAAPAENGIYVVPASGAPVRSTDCNSGTTYVAGAFVFVESGTVNSGSAWVVGTQGAINVGTTSVSWVQFNGAVSYTAGAGLQLVGSTFSVVTTGVSTEVVGNAVRVKSNASSGQPLLSQGTANEANYGALNLATPANITGALPVANGGTGAATAALARAALGVPSKFAAAVGDGSTTSIVVTHNLGTQDVVVMVYTASGNFAKVTVEVQITSANTITLIFAAPPTSNQYRVVVIG